MNQQPVGSPEPLQKSLESPAPPKQFPSVSWALFLLMFYFSISGLAGILLANIMEAVDVSFGILALGNYLLTVGGTTVLGLCLARTHWSQMFPKRRVPKQALAPLPFVVVGSWVVTLQAFFALTHALPIDSSLLESMRQLFENSPGLAFFMAVVLAPFLEETLFRGILLRGFLSRYSPPFSIFLSALLFGVFHLNPWQFVPALVVGCLSGWLFYRTGSLIPSILVHFMHNLTTLISPGPLEYLLDYPVDIETAHVLPLLPWSFVLFGLLLAFFGLIWLKSALGRVGLGR